MPGHADILDQRDNLRTPVLGSFVLHAAVFGALALYGISLSSKQDRFGDKVAGGGAVAISPVSTIPLPARAGHVNPVANDTESRLPQAPPKPVIQKKAPPPEPKAIALKSRVTPPAPARTETSPMKYRPQEVVRPNQVYAREAPAMVSPMMQAVGSGAIGVGPNSVLGNRFGAYASLIIQRVAQKWQTNGLDAQSQSVPVSVTFEINRDGSIRNPQLAQRSGNSQLDYSTLRAVTEAAPFPRLPMEYEKDSATVELQFTLKR